MNSRFLMCFAALTLFAATVSLAAQGQRKKHVQYTVTDLGTLGGSFSEPHGINKRDWIVGASTTEGDLELHAFLWRHGMMTDLGTLGGPNSIAGTLAEDAKNGQIPGLAETSTLDPLGEDFCGFGTHLICLAFLWQDGVMNPLPAAGGNNSIGAEVNRRGQVVGTTENNTPDPNCAPPQVLQIVGAIWRNRQIEQQLPPFPGDSASAAQAINDHGHATGSTGLCFPSRAVLWRDGQVIDLGNLGSTFFNAPFDHQANATVFEWLRRYPRTAKTAAFKVFQTGAGVNDPKPHDMAFAHRSSHWLSSIELYWKATTPPDVLARNMAWLDGFYDAIVPLAKGGAYQNFIDPSLRDWQLAYHDGNFQRLRKIKSHVDPTNIFRFAEGIPPV